jgi:hypothetical protein
MGTIQHHAIILTTDEEYIAPVLAKAKLIFGDMVTPTPLPSVRNGYVTILIGPDGSKEGWEPSNTGDHRRAEFKAWLRQEDNYPGYHTWVEVEYGELGYRVTDSDEMEVRTS